MFIYRNITINMEITKKRWKFTFSIFSCNLQPATCNLQPATCNLQPATCNLPPATCNLP
jgi:hypothetical protein